jgi:hypothetical protein
MNEPYIETAKEVAGKSIGSHDLIYITIIVAMGVASVVGGVISFLTDIFFVRK